MFGIFKSKYDQAVKAVSDFIADMAMPVGALRGSVLRDPYCLGFLQIVGMHIAAKNLKGSKPEEFERAFEDAIRTVAPRFAAEAAELLPLIRSENSPANAAYLRGRRDGDTFMAYKLLQVLSATVGEPARERFYDRIRHVMSPPSPPQQEELLPQTRLQPSEKKGIPSVEVSKWLVQCETRANEGLSPLNKLNRTYNFSGLPPPDTTATLTIIITVETTRLAGDLEGETESWRFIHGLCLYLQPFRLPQETPLVMQLFTFDELERGKFDVLACPIEGNSNTALIAEFGDDEHLEKCLSAIISGRDMIFVLMDQGRSLVNFRLPNDEEFMQLYEDACDQLTRFQIDTDIMRARDQGKPQAVSSVGNDERPATEHMAFVSEPPARSGIKIVRKRTVTKIDGGGTVEQTAWQTMGGDELVQCEFDAVYPRLERVRGSMGIFFKQGVERVRFSLAPEDIHQVGAETYIRKDLNYVEFGGKLLDPDNVGFGNRLAVKPKFDKWGGWEFEFADAICVTLAKFQTTMTAESIVANCICSESFKVSIGRYHDLQIGSHPGSFVETFASVVLRDIEGLRQAISDIAGGPYLGKLLRRHGYVVDNSRE